ncbi:MAG: matrixin family metalloprotease [Limisphaerales bacterium]
MADGGGRVGEVGEVASDAPTLRVGDARLFLLGRRADGTLFVDNGASGAPLLAPAGTGKTATSTMTDPNALALLSAARSRYPRAAGLDLTAQAASLIVPLAVPGLLTTNGVSRRFTAGDRGEASEYLVDADALPAGLTQAQALNALSNAFQAWANVTSLRFRFAGVTSFGTAAGNVTTNDGRIRVQLHDSYNFISGSTTLGVGGNSFSISGTFPNGGMGGRVNGNEFFPVSYGYLVMKHSQSSLQTLSTFEEVLGHEIGHVLSMDHSSENSSEPNTTLKQAIMFFQAHADGRGAALGTYDPPVVQQAYPKNNTPPYRYNRMMQVVTAATAPNLAGVNEVEVRGYDLQTNALTLTIASATSANGTFTLNGSTLRYTPSAFFGDSSKLDPATTSAFDRAFLRLSDGTHGSPYIEVRVLSFNADSFSDGVPDNWMTQFFGSANPSAGSLRGPNDDFDGDGVSNLNEFRLGTNPTNAASVLRFTSGTKAGLNWFATPYEVYEVQGTTNFTNWFRVGNPVVPTTTNGSFTNFPATDRLFFRLERVP